MTFAFEFELSEAQQIRASRWMALRQRESRAALGFFILVGVLSLAHLLIMLTRGSGVALSVAGITMAVAGGYLVAFWSPRAQVRQLRERNRAADSSHSYVLSDRGLQATSQGLQSSTEWANVVEGIETKEFFLFFISKGSAQVLPKAAVPEGEFPALREALAGWLEGRFRGRGR